MSAPEIAPMWLTDESHVRGVIHDFNERGFDALDPDYRGGRPRRIDDEARQRIVAVAGVRPDRQGVPLTRWSLDRLAWWLAEQQLAQISQTHLRRLLDQAGLAFLRTRSWKASPDPDYWVQDNLSANWTPDIRAFAAGHKIELVPTPTYASYLNRIECHFRPIQEFVFNNTDYPHWDAARAALADHITHRNGPDRHRRITELERRHTRMTTVPVKRSGGTH